MTEFCPDHSGVIRSQGRMEGKIDEMSDDVKEMNRKIDKLVANGITSDTARIVTMAERRWVHWVLVTAIGASVLMLVQTIVPKLIKALAGVLQ